MHNFLAISETQTTSWLAYQHVNQRISQEIVKIKKRMPKIKVVWVHGDQLMLTPNYIRKGGFLDANIGFYFHSSFPASGVFMSFYHRKEFLHSLLQADLVGFHLYEFARNFINACKRLFKLQNSLTNKGIMSVAYLGRTVVIRVSHIGIDEEFIDYIMKSDSYRKQVETF